MFGGPWDLSQTVKVLPHGLGSELQYVCTHGLSFHAETLSVQVSVVGNTPQDSNSVRSQCKGGFSEPAVKTAMGDGVESHRITCQPSLWLLSRPDRR
jgi:hypothetical protein